MADRYFVNDDVDGDFEGTNNWSATSGGAGGASIPGASDTAIFDGAGTNGDSNCDMSAAVSVTKITATAGYSSVFTQNAYKLTLGTGGFDLTGATGAWHFEDEMDVSGDLVTSSSLTDIDFIGVTMTVKEDVAWNVVESIAAGEVIGQITIEANKTFTLTVGIAISAGSGNSSVVFASGSTLDMNGQSLSVNCDGTVTPLDFSSGGTITTTGTGSYLTFTGNGTAVVTLPALDFTTSHCIVRFHCYNNGGETTTFNMGGDITCYRIDYVHLRNGITSTAILNCSTYDMDLGNDFNITATAGTNTGTLTVNLGTGSNQHSFDELNPQTDVGATINLNFQTATVALFGNVAHDFTATGTLNVDGGTGVLSFVGTGAMSLTSDGQTFYDVLVNSVGGGLTLNDAFSCNDFDVDDGEFDQNGQTMTVAGGVDIAVANDITMDGGLITVETNFNVISGAGTYNQHGMELRFTKSGLATILISASQSGTNAIKTILLDSGTSLGLQNTLSLRNDGATSVTLTDATCTFGLYAQTCRVYTNGTSTPIVLNGGNITATTAGAGFQFFSTDTADIKLPAISTGTNHTLLIRPSIATGKTATFTAGGNITCSGLDVFHNLGSSTGEVIIDMDTYNLVGNTASVITTTLNTNTGVVTLNMGSGTHSMPNMTFDSDAGASQNFNPESSTITFTGSQDFTSAGSLTYTAATETIVLTGASATLTSDGVTFNILQFNSPGNSINTADATDAARILIEPNMQVNWADSLNVTAASYTAGDIDGTAGNLVVMSGTPGISAWNYVNPASMEVSYVDVTNSNATNVIDADDGTNVDGGGNTNWTFTAGGFSAAFAKGSNILIMEGD